MAAWAIGMEMEMEHLMVCSTNSLDKCDPKNLGVFNIAVWATYRFKVVQYGAKVSYQE